MEKTIAIIEKNRREEIRVSLTAYHNRDLVDIRVFSETYTSDERIATRKGVCLNVTKLPDLIAALQQTEAEAKAAGLLKEPEVGAAAPDSAGEGGLTVLGAG